MGLLALGIGIGIAVAFFLDPQSGRRRRAMTKDRAFGKARKAAREAEQAGRLVAAEAYGVSQKLTHLREEEKPQPDDVTLAHKVETEIFRPADVPKGQINVNAENGVIVLRGEVPRPEMIDDLVERARKVQGVRDVENLLHLPNTEAPMHQAYSRDRDY
jgi:osmotically-inducible protein OsmY